MCNHAGVPRGQLHHSVCKLVSTHVQVPLGLSAHSPYTCVYMCVHGPAHVQTLPGFGSLYAPYSRPSPLPSTEVASGAAAQKVTRGVRAAIATGSSLCHTLVHILAAPQGLVKVKVRGIDTVEAAQHVLAEGHATGHRQQDTHSHL